MSSVKDLLRLHWRIIVFVLILVFVLWLCWELRSVLLPFIIGLILTYLLLPIIRWIERRLHRVGKKPRYKQIIRISIILIVYFLSLGAIGLLIFYSITLIAQAVGELTQDLSQIIPNGLDTIQQWLKSISLLSNPTIQENIDVYIAKAAAALPTLLIDFLTQGIKVVQTSAGTILGFLIMPFFIFYLLKDWSKLRDGFYAALPSWMRTHTESIFGILQNVVVRYIRGQLLLGLVVGTCVYILLLILKIPFALPLAVFAGLTELVPMIGPWLGGAMGVLVTLATAPEKIIWVVGGYLVIQLLENNLLVPKIQGTQMGIHPAYIMILSVLGAYFAGILGFIIVLPVTMALARTIKYLRESAHSMDIK